ncbi:hypothetical protein [Paractinoplanes atraurantiacus]|uniref:Uncharacterized protein n=1 Tax=Paractinoplanes atraurantiacus TaxID=1036182 RepID=A0A285I1B6_9ACTN|nr:hypothetical protein [Actinoplanes atraurantiacus]SNY40866.1 hypothetical protein SAMN05421748_10693 [Actinoplanes atraurantiacus]
MGMDFGKPRHREYRPPQESSGELPPLAPVTMPRPVRMSVESLEGRHPVAEGIRAFGENVAEQAAWSAAKHFADAVAPGAGLIVGASYVAIKALGAVTGANVGRGFMVVIPAQVPGTELAFSVGVRQASDSFGVQFRVDLMDDAYFEGAPAEPPAPNHGSWPGEWTLEYGLAGIRDHGAVLSRVVPLPGGVPRFADRPGSASQAVWDMSAARRWRVRVPGCDPLYVTR